MPRTTVTRHVRAPVGEVFDTVAHIENFRKAIPGIFDVELLSDVDRGVGTRFRETRIMGGREARTELEVTEYVPDERVRLVADAGGTIWDTLFTTTVGEDGTNLTLVMDARPHKLLARLVVPLTRRMIAKAVAADMDYVKAYCER